ncbi:MAG: SIR2 family protein [Lactobacillus sp.]|uniref:SIR2 family protein n=1 Tax=Lactobacillus sp. TaxID=1591 RepID=UPI0023C36E67|nr:SIR2 family protein [Lactobacillus sp.]MDE7050461.1 SIR2 family protein [Lactobacillus sp.]
MTFLENIKHKNQFPIIFIGSGITKRYFENAPDWETLLLNIWEEVDSKDNFYKENYNLNKKYANDDFKRNVELAKELSNKYNDAFYEQKVKLENLSLKDAYEKRINPFKQRVANVFSSLIPKNDFEEEKEAFSKMLVKARMVITTNYDLFIEDSYKKAKTSVQVHIGNRGLFEKTEDYGELYKIHGSISDVNSIVITSEDYSRNESKSALIDAKILSNLTESPIIFLGYSLTDKNVQRLLNSFVENAPFDISQAASRIGVVTFSEGEKEIKEVIEGLANNRIHYTSLKTDNFLEVYNSLASINQSITPAEIRKYEANFRRIIEIKGQQQTLKTVLADYEDISKLSDKEIKNKKIVVAFGDEKILYKVPTYVEYLINYFTNNNDFSSSIAIKFIAQQTSNTPLPIKKYINQIKTEIHNSDSEKEKIKLEKRLRNYGSLTYDGYIKSLQYPAPNKESRIYVSSQIKSKFKNISNPFEILNAEEKSIPKINYLTQNLKKFDRKIVDKLVSTLLTRDENQISGSHYRKFFMAYSLLDNQKSLNITKK